MKTRIFVIDFPAFDDVMEKIGEAFDCIFDEEPEPRPAPVRREPCGCHTGPAVPNPEWEVCGEPADENLRFGASFAVDEPRASDYDNREDFEYDHQLFDEFVSAGEDCVERGLARPDGVTVHRCNAIRQRLDEKPPRDIELLGETDWWSNFGW